MENDLVPLNVGLHSDLRMIQERTVWYRLAAMDTVTHSGMEYTGIDDDDDDIYDNEHRLK